MKSWFAETQITKKYPVKHRVRGGMVMVMKLYNITESAGDEIHDSLNKLM